ncbi:hypothetical protein [Leifsonia aquatica]|uniref:hypothetical protein n=1 Tax=Leifsonia aquatica TaxID=144185 RepID=UPI00380FE369
MMTQRTHIQTTNGQSRSFLSDRFNPYRAAIHRMLGLLDGTERWSYTLERALNPDDIASIDHAERSHSFLQAGGAADRLALEVRYVEDDGKERQYAVGKPGGQYSGDPTETVIIGGNEFHVYPDEVFTADEATDVFYGYFQNDRVPEQYPLRRLDFSAYE